MADHFLTAAVCWKTKMNFSIRNKYVSILNDEINKMAAIVQGTDTGYLQLYKADRAWYGFVLDFTDHHTACGCQGFGWCGHAQKTKTSDAQLFFSVCFCLDIYIYIFFFIDIARL